MSTLEKPQSDQQARLGLRLKKEHKERIEQAAAMTGQTVNSFASGELLKRSDEILAKEEVRLLSNAARDRFIALLDSETEPNEALKVAAKEYKKGRHIGAEYYFETLTHGELSLWPRYMIAVPLTVVRRR